MSDYNKILSFTDSLFNENNTTNYSLSIELSFDGFSFCILDRATFKYLAIESYNFERILCYNDLNTCLNQILQHEWFKCDYHSVNLIFYNHKSTLIPIELFDEQSINSYLSFNHLINNEDNLIYEKLNNLNAYNVYTIPKIIKSLFDEKFKNIKYRHSSSSLIENTYYQYQNNDNKKIVIIHLQSNHFEALVLQGKTFLFYNTFAFKTAEDFLYYLIFVTEQLEIDIDNQEFIILGEVAKDSPLSQQIYTFIKNYRFGDRTDIFKYSNVFDDIPLHYYYNLFNIIACG